MFNAKFFTFTVLLLAPGQTLALNIQPHFQFGFDFGGDNLANPALGQEHELQAGDGLYFNLGSIWRMTEHKTHNFELQTTIGYRFFFSGNGDQGEIDITQIPLEIIYFYSHQQKLWRFGYGLSHYIGNDFETSGVHATSKKSFNSSTGFIIALEKTVTQDQGSQLGIGLRMTLRSLKDRDTNEKFNADSLGLYLTWMPKI